MIIWLASYPRSGNTLLRLILKSVFERNTYSKHDDANDIGADARLAEEVGHQFLGATWPEAYRRMQSSDELYLVKTHDMPEDDGKAVYIVRDGRPACRSFYHYLKDFPSLDTQFSVRDVVAGFTPFGSWGDHLDHWDPLHRPNTILIRYEDLVANPIVEIQKLAAFTGLVPLHDWQNNFEKLHEMNPRFFRTGSTTDAASALDTEEQAIFWAQHGDWMRKLDYPESNPTINDAIQPYRRLISDKGREYFNLRERVFIAERRVMDLQQRFTAAADAGAITAANKLDAEHRDAAAAATLATLQAEHNDALAQLREQLAVERVQIESDRRTAIEQQLTAERMRDELAVKYNEAESQLKQTVAHLADTTQVREQLAAEIAKLKEKVASVSKEQAEVETRLAESRSLIVEHLVGVAKTAAARNSGAGQVSDSSTVAHDLREDIHRMIATWDKTSSALREEIEKHRTGRAVAITKLRHSRRLMESTLSREVHQRESQVLELNRHLENARATRDQLQHLLEQFKWTSYAARKHYARSIDEQEKAAAVLTAAVIEQNVRLRMLLRSRFLHLGWKLGFGKTPYWSEPDRDEITPVIAILNSPPESKSLINNALRGAAHSPGPTSPTGNDMESALRHLVEKGFSPDVVLDVGSSNGYWPVVAGQRWPAAEIVMIDPRRENETESQALCRDPRFQYHHFDLRDDSAGHSGGNFETLDRLISEGKVKPPGMVKLDLQGLEIRALDDGQKLFSSADVFIISVNLFQFTFGGARLHEAVKYMADRGFFPFDFAGSLRRPLDNDLGQVDVVFVRGTSPMVASNLWLAPDISAIEVIVEPPGEVPTVTPAVEPAETAPIVVDVPQPPLIDDATPMTVSVIICTKDPRMEILDRTLDSLENQTLSKDLFELIIVDSNSSPPLTLAQLQGRRTLRPSLVVESVAGLSRARCAGIATATGRLFVFVDDDNFLDPAYLERAVAIARTESRIGLFGGISVVELESPIPKWKQAVLPYLGVRDYGPEPITAFADHWGEWEPIGAGMVARREVAEKFVEMYHASTDAQQLGRNGNALLSGEDSLFARAAHRIGYSCSYQPSLKLVHFMKKSRMNLRYLARLLEGHGRSYVLLHRTLGKPTEPLKMRTAVARLMYRLQTAGRAGAITWFWDLGYAAEKRNERSDTQPLLVAANAIHAPELEHLEGARHGA